MTENLNLKTVETVDTRPFRKLVMTIGELPTSFIESMTYYELLAWFTNYLETVIIPTVNNNGEAVEELQQKYVELKANTEQEIADFEDTTNTEINRFETELTEAFNTLQGYVDNYFDNLDVQEEINNKLDQMAEDGVLQEIITTYIQSNVAWTFDTVAEMKQATNLVDGSYARTLGFYSVNDGGGGLYYITDTGTANEMDVILVNSTLYATLITDDTVNILQLGAKANDENFNNQPILQRTFALKKTTIIGNNDEQIFWVQGASRFYNSIIFNAWLKNKGSQGRELDRIIYIENVWSDKTIEVINPLINGNRDITKAFDAEDNDEYGHGINIRSCQNVSIKGGKIINCYGDSVTISTSNDPDATYRYSKNIVVENVYMDYPYRNGISVVSGLNVDIKNCTVYNRNGFRTILIEPNEDNTLVNENIHINGGYYYGSSGASVIQYQVNRNVKNVSIKNCTVHDADGCSCPIRVSPVSPYTLSNIDIENVTIENHRANSQILINTSGDINFNNITIIGDKTIADVQIKSIAGDISVRNNYVDLVDNGTNQKIRYDIYCTTGIVYFTDNIIKATNSTSAYSGQVNIQEGKIIFIERNVLYNTANAFGIGTPSSSTTPSHNLSTKCCYMIDNYVKADANYPNSRAILVYSSTDMDTIWINYNFYDGITNKKVIWGDVTNTIGDVFN